MNLICLSSSSSSSSLSNMERRCPPLWILRLNLPAVPATLHKRIISQKESKRQNQPFQTKHYNTEPAGHLQDHRRIILPDVRLQRRQEIGSRREDQNRNRSLENGRQDGGHHVGGVPPV